MFHKSFALFAIAALSLGQASDAGAQNVPSPQTDDDDARSAPVVASQQSGLGGLGGSLGIAAAVAGAIGVAAAAGGGGGGGGDDDDGAAGGTAQPTVPLQ